METTFESDDLHMGIKVDNIVYRDRFVTLSDESLKLAGFHVSSSRAGGTKSIGLNEILHFQKCNGDSRNKPITLFGVTWWGLGSTGIYWARDGKRLHLYMFPSRKRAADSIVITRLGMYGRVGFSVERVEEFLSLFEESLRKSRERTAFEGAFR